jgi:hypothetical protein
MEKVLRLDLGKQIAFGGTSMKKKFSMMILMLGSIVGGLFTSATYATTRNGVTCGLFDSVDEPGAIHWPVNGNLYYCGDTPTSNAAGVSVVWNAAQGATQRVVGSQVVPFLRQTFTATGVEVYVFNTVGDFQKYFGYTFTPPPLASIADIAGFTAKPGQVLSHPGPFTAIFQHSPSINSDPKRLLLIAQTTNHEMGHEMDRAYLYPSGALAPRVSASQNYLNAVNLDITHVNQLTCLQVFGGTGLSSSVINSVCSTNSTNWTRMRGLWPYDTTADEFFANVFAADSPGGAVNEPLATIIGNDFTHTVEYERGLRTGTGKP